MYRPPNGDMTIFEKFCKNLLFANDKTSKNIIFAGDLNIYSKWGGRGEGALLMDGGVGKTIPTP